MLPDLVDRCLAKPVQPVELTLEFVSLIFFLTNKWIEPADAVLCVAELPFQPPRFKLDLPVLGIDKRVLVLKRFLGHGELPTGGPRVFCLVPQRFNDLALDPIHLAPQVFHLALPRLNLVEPERLHPVLKWTKLGVL